MTDSKVFEPRLFFLSKNCVDCPKAMFDFGVDEDDLGEWRKTNLKIRNGDHVILNGNERVLRDGALQQLSDKDEILWDGESVPDEILSMNTDSELFLPARVLDQMNKHNELPVGAFL